MTFYTISLFFLFFVTQLQSWSLGYLEDGDSNSELQETDNNHTHNKKTKQEVQTEAERSKALMEV